MKKIGLLVTVMLLAVSLWGCGFADALSEFLDTQPTVPEQELNGILDALDDMSGGISLSVHTDDGDIYGPYKLDRLPELDKAMGRPVEAPTGLGRYDNWLVLTAGNGDAVMTVYVGNRDMVCMEKYGHRDFYRDDSGSLARPLRRCFDKLEYEAAVLRVEPLVHTPSGVLRAFATDAYPALRMSLAPGSIYGFQDYDLMDYELLEATATTLTGTVVYAALPDAEDSPIYGEGKLLEEAPYEGYVLITETVDLELHEDGFWYRTSPSLS